MTLRSPLFEEHVALGARMVTFGGWELPLSYRGVIAEHRAVRERVGLFDVSHLGKLIVDGPGAASVLDRLLPGKIVSLPLWRARYNLLLTPAGGIVDDVFVYRRPESFVVVPNAANTPAVLDAIRTAVGAAVEEEASVIDARARWAILALQGPAARIMAEELLVDANRLGLHSFMDIQLGGVEVQFARTGYTGELGFEIFVPSAEAVSVWRELLEAGESHGIQAAGLGARDTLRLEMGYPLHGQDISADTNPLEAGLGWVIDWSKPDFRGRKSLERVRRQGPQRRLVGLVTQTVGIPRSGQAIFDGGRRVGEVTSGNFSPTLKKGIALGYVLPEATAPDTILQVDVRGKRVPARVTRPPFVGRGRGSLSH
ncbi:MAG: glycine cleavage system aminomethyltransferase GcvT [Actinomycetota bacterium]